VETEARIIDYSCVRTADVPTEAERVDIAEGLRTDPDRLDQLPILTLLFSRKNASYIYKVQFLPRQDSALRGAQDRWPAR
jgi:hypothetical protein